MSSTKFLLHSFVVTYCIALNILVIVVPLYAITLGFTSFELGLIVAIPGIMQLLLRIAGGVLADQFGERLVLIGSVVALIMSTLVFLIFDTFWFILIAQSFVGISRSVFYDSCQSYATRWRPSEAGRTLSQYISSVNFGNVSGFLFGGGVSSLLGYNWAFGLSILFSVSALIIVLFMQDLPQRLGERIYLYVFPMLRVRPLYLAGIAAFIAATPIILMGSFYPAYFRQIGYSDGIIGLLASMHSIGMVISGFIFKFFEKRFSTIVVFGGSFIGVGMLTSFSILLINPWSLTMLLILLGIISGFANILYLQITTEYTLPEQRGIGMAISGQFWSLANFLVPFVFGILVSHTDIRTAFGLGGVSVLIMGLMSPLLFTVFLNNDSKVRSSHSN